MNSVAVRSIPRSLPRSSPAEVVSSIERGLDALARLRDPSRMAKAKTPGGFAAFEREALEAALIVARGTIAEAMSAADESAEAVEVQGKTLRRVLRSPQTFMTAAGEVVLERWLYADRSEDRPRALSPMEKRLGIVEGFWTPEAASRGLWMVAQLTPAKVAEALERVSTMTPSRASLDRLAKAVSSRWEQDREALDATLREGLVLPEGTASVVVSLDGVLAPMEGADPIAHQIAAEEAGHAPRGPAGYREIGCATLSFCDAKGELLSAIRMARAPEAKKATLKGQLLSELGAVLQRQPGLRVVKVADAAADNWEFLSEAVGPGAEAIDFFHAGEHLHAALAAVYGEGKRETRLRYEELSSVLREDVGGVDRVIRALEYLRKKAGTNAVVTRELAFFRKHRGRMKYAELRAEGLAIGSGVVEAACKSLVAQRLKLSGMRWSAKGAQSILTLRGWDQSERFDQAWALLAATYHAEVHVLAHVVALKSASR